MTYITIEEMARRIGERPEYVRDKLVKRPDFPRPVLVLSRKIRKWAQEDFDAWLDKKRKEWAR